MMIETERFILRPFTEVDEEDVFEYLQKPAVNCFVSRSGSSSFLSREARQTGCKYSKGSIQIPYSDDLPLELIAEITAWCRESGNHA